MRRGAAKGGGGWGLLLVLVAAGLGGCNRSSIDQLPPLAGDGSPGGVDLIGATAPDGVRFDAGPAGSDAWLDPVEDCPEVGERIPVATLLAAMVGSWRGTSESVWSGKNAVEMSFTADRHYSARAVSGRDSALYFAPDGGGSSRTFAIERTLANGDGTGTIQLEFGTGGTIPAYLHHVRSCARGARLDFQLYRQPGFEMGPVTLRLGR